MCFFLKPVAGVIAWHRTLESWGASGQQEWTRAVQGAGGGEGRES